jgi:hypothetical protein
MKLSKALTLLTALIFIAPLHAQKKPKEFITIAVSPTGDSNAALERAKKAVRFSSAVEDVHVQLADGIYRLDHTLTFTAFDGGRNGHQVVWEAAPNAHPVISGAITVTGWKLFDAAKQIYVADTPIGLDTRQLWVNDTLAPVASTEIPRKSVEFTREGIVFKDPKFDALLASPSRLEVSATGFFTKRIAPVDHVSGHTLVMKQPAWDNNIWGYDTLNVPYHPELAHLYLANSLALLSEPGQWYIDPAKGKLYLRPAAGVDITTADIELPHLTALISIGNSLANPVENLTFRNIRFSHTTWLGPSSNEGYASQQSGSYLTGHAAAYPSDPIKECPQGCPAFESVRNTWRQMPASIQVSAAEHITFDHDVFAHLGQYALGIGNDADAAQSGVGLGTGDIVVSACVFTDLAGGAILAGGVRPEAHHPHDPRAVNRALIVQNNRIQSVSKDYLDNSAILSTYNTGAAILHNDISDVPYDAIDIGYGWGMHDPGGNPNYRFRMHGYDYPQNLTYETPTTHRDVIVASNRIRDAKKLFHDGGAIYNLSASPGTLITENYIFDIHGLIGLYLDEGSRYITVRRNVVDDPNAEWLNVNTVHSAYPMRISPDNTAINNWHNSAKIGGLWNNYQNNLILDDHLIKDSDWPAEAREVMKNSGIEPSAGPVTYGDAKP